MAALDDLIAELERSYTETRDRMSDPAVYNDHREAAEVGRRLKQLEGPYNLALQWKQARADLDAARGDSELTEMVTDYEDEVARLEEELKLALAERDPADERDVKVEIEESDLKIDVYRSSGPGGQSVNTTDSAVRITHLPTGIVVAMQDERSQLQNRDKAMRVLRARVYEAERERQAAEQAAARSAQVGTGARAEKIRTYNFPENRVTDHRIKLTTHRLDQILQGDLDDYTDALTADQQRRSPDG